MDSINYKETARSAVNTVISELTQFIGKIMFLRVLLTLLITAWLAFITYNILYTKSDDEDYSRYRTKYFELHRVYFGDEAPLRILFNMWFYVVLLFLLAPLIQKMKAPLLAYFLFRS